ncbi:cytochrome P450 3A19-like [Oppia nitens]|uniref:cytochrome P450 3A19-like n=1 Tax=Oppia nitens TaxID=1686743 RepID=UPI0023DA082B|nr:cytochrome P450 3A19-like [Oppia nitens]
MFSWKHQQQNTINGDDPNNKFTKLIKCLLFPSKWRILAHQVLPEFCLQVLNITNIIEIAGLDQFAELVAEEFTKRLKPTETIAYDDFFQTLLDRCPEFIDKTNGKTLDQQWMTKEEVMANMFALFDGGFVGHYTSMTFLIYELAINTDCQQKLYDELINSNCFVDSRLNGQFDWETVGKLDYLNACLSESLRLHSAINRDGRLANQDYTDETTGLTIKKGQEIQLSHSAVQQCPDYYRMPDQFIPDRFVKHNKHQLVDSAYLPFGLGRRMCPGYKFALMAIKLTMAHLLIRYNT